MQNFLRIFVSKNILKCIIIILGGTLYFCYKACSNMEHKTEESSELPKTPNFFVILASSLNPRYLFVLPFTVAAWKKLNVEAIVVLVGREENFMTNPQSNETLTLLKELKTHIIFMQPQKLSHTSFSQLIRLFGAVLPFSWLSDKDILITSDADLAVFHLNNHIPNTLKGKTLHLYNANCCEPVMIPPRRGNYKVHMFPMGTIGATIKTWKDIMGFYQPSLNVQEIESYIINEFGETFMAISDKQMANLIGSPIWYADQSLISYKLNLWFENSTNHNFVSLRTTAPRRIDRISWPTPMEFSSMNINDWDDCHQPVDAFNENTWKNFKPFLNLIFEKKLVEMFSKYQIQFLFKFFMQ